MPGIVDGQYPEDHGADAADVDVDVIQAMVDLAEEWKPDPGQVAAASSHDLLAEPTPGSGLTFEPDHQGLWPRCVIWTLMFDRMSVATVWKSLGRIRGANLPRSGTKAFVSTPR